MTPIRYYHVMNKDGEWHLYFGNSTTPILSDANRSTVVKAARALARQSGMKVIIHKAAEQESKPRSGDPQEPGSTREED